MDKSVEYIVKPQKLWDSLKDRGNWNWPNKITLARILVCPFIFCFFWIDLRWWALSITSLAILSDALDGAIARWRDQKTELGAFLDPVADKMLITVLFFSLPTYGVSWQWVGTILLIELCVSIGALGTSIKVRWWGKCKINLQLAAVVYIMYELPLSNEYANDIIVIVCWLTFFSFFLYCISIVRGIL